MIVDIHAHAFPALGQPIGRMALEQYRWYLQHHVMLHPVGTRRLADGSPVPTTGLWDGEHDGLSGLVDVGLRVGEYGRLEWTVDGEDRFLQWMPPSLRRLEHTPEQMLAQMKYVGVDVAVLQHHHVYGDLNEWFAGVLKAHRGKFVCLAAVDEWRIDRPDEIERLRSAVEDLGLAGLYFAPESFFMVEWQDTILTPRFEPFWREVERLGIPIFWDLLPNRKDPQAAFHAEVRRLTQWAQGHPAVPNVLTHGISQRLLRDIPDRLTIPQDVWDLLQGTNTLLEIDFSNTLVIYEDFPFPEGRRLIRELYERLGPWKLMWGSDMPAAERWCTYRQSLEYLRRGCDFITAADMEIILGQNPARLFGLKTGRVQ
ncbi:MAG: amidohydrolase family protein [Chloroflexi bacterium]|nr:amidohydrolase family protein [Chloroflexota bacterium]